MNKYKLTLIISSLALISVFTSCGGEETKTFKETRTPVKVEVEKVSRTDSGNEFLISGLVASDNEVELSAKVMGYIEYLPFDVGDKVGKGTLIAKIKNQEVNTKVDQVASMITQAEISLNAIEKDYNRIKRLFDQQSATQKELDDITTMMESTKAKIQQLEANKNEAGIMSAYSEIRSPIGGVITSKYKQAGEMASPGHPIVTVEDQNDKIIKVYIPESHIRSVSTGSPVKFKAGSEINWISGKITEIASSAKSGQYAAKISLPKSSDFLSGMYTEVIVSKDDKLDQSNLQGNITIKKDALFTRGQLTGIYVPTDQNTAIVRWIVPGKIMGDVVEIISGLEINDTYITQSSSRLVNGMPIEY